jgi:WD40 repeat protein
LIILLFQAGCIEEVIVPATSNTTATPSPISSSESMTNGTVTFTLPPSNKKPTPYPGQAATMEVRWTQTKQAINENCDGFSSVWYQLSDPQFLISPDGRWSAAYCTDPSSQLPYTKLTEAGTNKRWNIPFYETFGAAHNRRDGILGVIHWSVDGKYAYLDAYFCCLDGPGMMFVNTYGLYRVDLKAGNVQEILPNAGAVAFSPNGQYLIGNDYSKNIVHVYDLKNDTDKVFSFDKKYSQTGLFVWSSDSQKVIFAGALPNWEDTLLTDFETPAVTPETKQDGFSLLLIDLKTDAVITLIDNDPRLFRPSQDYQQYAWISDYRVLIFDRTGAGHILNIETNQLSIAPTPTLSP